MYQPAWRWEEYNRGKAERSTGGHPAKQKDKYSGLACQTIPPQNSTRRTMPQKKMNTRCAWLVWTRGSLSRLARCQFVPRLRAGLFETLCGGGGGHTADRQSYSIGIYTPFPRAPFPRAPSPHLLVSPPHKFLLEEPQDWKQNLPCLLQAASLKHFYSDSRLLECCF